MNIEITGRFHTDQEGETAERLARETPASLGQAFDILVLCRGEAITPDEVMECARERDLDPVAAFQFLYALEEQAGRILNTPLSPAERTLECENVQAPETGIDRAASFVAAADEDEPPKPPPNSQLHVRQPKTKSERRLIRDIVKGVKARNAAMTQLAQANRAIMKAEKGLRAAGMVSGVTPEGLDRESRQ